MKTAGIVGGIGPESTIDYYRSIIAEYRERRPEGEAPSIVITSLDPRRLLALAAVDAESLVGYLLPELTRLERAGADFAVLAANTVHARTNKSQR